MKIWKAFLLTGLYVLLLNIVSLTALLAELVPLAWDIHVYQHLLVLSMQLGSLLLFIGIYVVLKRIGKWPKFGKISNLKTDLKWVILAIILGILMVYGQVLNNLFSAFLFQDLPYTPSKLALDPFESQDIYRILRTVILAPLMEEVFFRGYLLCGMLESYQSKWIPVLASAVLFALIHVNWYYFDWYTNVNLFSLTFVGGLFMGFLYVKTNKLIYPILLHFTWNIVATSADYINYPYLYF